MRSTKALLIVTAVAEAGVGLTLLVSPALATWLLLNVGQPALEAVVVGRVCGAALLAISVACWIAQSNREAASQRALVLGALVYNVGVAVVLGSAGMTSGPLGVGLWPTVAAHTCMAAWCLACLGTSAAALRPVAPTSR